MSNKPTAKVADATIAQLFTKETLLNGQHYTITEQRHVLIGNCIFYRLRLQPEQGQEVKIDIPIETNKPSQLSLTEAQEEQAS